MKKFLLLFIITFISINVFSQKLHKTYLKCDSKGDLYLSSIVENTTHSSIVYIIFKVRYNDYYFSYMDKEVEGKVNIPGYSKKTINFYPPIQNPKPNKVMLSRVVYANGQFKDFYK